MELVAFGFLIGVVTCLVMIMGGILYDRLIIGDDRKHLLDTVYGVSDDANSLCDNLKADRLDIQAQDREKGKGAKE